MCVRAYISGDGFQAPPQQMGCVWMCGCVDAFTCLLFTIVFNTCTCTHVCMYMYMYMCMYVSMYVFLYVCMYVCMCMYM